MNKAAMRQNIQQSMAMEKYDITLDYINEFFNILNKFDENYLDDLWFGYYYLSNCEMKMGNYKDAIDNICSAKELIKYKNKSRYIHSVWLLGSICRRAKETEKAISCLKECANYFLKEGNMKYYFNNTFDIYKLQNNVQGMEDTLVVYINAQSVHKTLTTYEGENYLDNQLIEMYSDILTIYTQENRKSDIVRLLNTITNTEVRTEMLNKFLVA